jgi:hypothetical protein
MTSRRSAAPTPGEQGTPRPQTLILTVRLFPNVHPALVAEFTNVGRRLRATRAAQLMMVGLLQEQAHLGLQRSAREGAPPDPPRRAEAPEPEPSISATNEAFVSSILNSAAA